MWTQNSAAQAARSSLNDSPESRSISAAIASGEGDWAGFLRARAMPRTTLHSRKKSSRIRCRGATRVLRDEATTCAVSGKAHQNQVQREAFLQIREYVIALARFTTTSIKFKFLRAQNISPPADCLDKFEVVITVNLTTQTAHMRFNNIRLWIEVQIPYLLK